MMTTVAAIVGTLPIAIGIERKRGVATSARHRGRRWAVLAFSQVVTLFVTPVFYTYLDDLQSWLGKVSSKLPWSSDHETPPADRPTLAAGD